ncbi:class I SAM-dependent methyltransferase [Candidatus Roizmanbacteria bacterium]|nr:class I SAM-dependent methyltransferase [Candidatus Roizmanbacteria bacterium]
MNPRPTAPNIEKFYKKNYYYDESMFDMENYIKAKILYQDIKKYLQNGSILDIGCSKAFLLNFMKEDKLLLHGIEPSEDSIRFAWNNFKIKVDKGYFESVKIKKNSYTNITAIDIIEHVNNPYNTLKKIYQILKKNGVVIVETPNIDSLYYSIGKDRWMGFALPFHIYYFAPKTLKNLFEQIGFRNITVETSHFNLISREGFFRSKGYGIFRLILTLLNFLGINPDIVANRVNQSFLDSAMKTKKKINLPNLSFLDKIEIFINQPLNYLFSKKLLFGDGVRVIAYK